MRGQQRIIGGKCEQNVNLTMKSVIVYNIMYTDLKDLIKTAILDASKYTQAFDYTNKI